MTECWDIWNIITTIYYFLVCEGENEPLLMIVLVLLLYTTFHKKLLWVNLNERP